MNPYKIYMFEQQFSCATHPLLKKKVFLSCTYIIWSFFTFTCLSKIFLALLSLYVIKSFLSYTWYDHFYIYMFEQRISNAPLSLCKKKFVVLHLIWSCLHLHVWATLPLCKKMFVVLHLIWSWCCLPEPPDYPVWSESGSRHQHNFSQTWIKSFSNFQIF